jgi:hypothetical protein
MWMVPLFASVLVAPLGGDATSVVAMYSIGPLVSFGLLGVITQLMITPLLDHAIPDRAAVRLSGAGATSSMAVSSSTTDA